MWQELWDVALGTRSGVWGRVPKPGVRPWVIVATSGPRGWAVGHGRSAQPLCGDHILLLMVEVTREVSQVRLGQGATSWSPGPTLLLAAGQTGLELVAAVGAVLGRARKKNDVPVSWGVSRRGPAGSRVMLLSCFR